MVTITIQAPAGGATLQVVAQHRALDVSIHAPAGGATDAGQMTAEDLKFQSTRPRGARPGMGSNATPGHPVSIHAPAGGATSSERQVGR